MQFPDKKMTKKSTGITTHESDTILNHFRRRKSISVLQKKKNANIKITIVNRDNVDDKDKYIRLG